MVVLVETVIEIVSRHAVGKHVGTIRATLAVCRTTTLLVASLLETVAVDTYAAILKITIVDSPAVVYQTGIDGIVEVPAIVGVSPTTVAVPLVARTRIELVGKAISIATMSLHIIVEVRVAVDNLVIATIEVFRIAVITSVAVLVEAQLQACVATTVEVAALHNAVGSLELHAAVCRLGDVDVAPIPVVGIRVHQHSAKLLCRIVASVGLLREVKDRIDSRLLIWRNIITEYADAMMTVA